MERRSNRVSEAQWNILIDFLARNPTLAKSRGYNNTASGRALSARLWSEVATRLNAEGSGTTKTAKDWSIYVSNYKSKLKKLVADTKVDISGTGGGPAQTESISSIDSRFLSILGPGFGRSSPRVPVDPFPDTAQSQPSTSTAVLPPPPTRTPHSVEEADIIGEYDVARYMEPAEFIIESEQHIVEPAATVDAEEPVPGPAAPPPTEPVDAEEPVPGPAAPPPTEPVDAEEPVPGPAAPPPTEPVDAEEPVPGPAAPPPTEPVDAEEPVPGPAAPPPTEPVDAEEPVPGPAAPPPTEPVDAEEPVPGPAAPPPTEPVDAEEPVPGSAAPPLPRHSRQRRQCSRPLAPLDEARRILSQIEMQRLRSDAATARALELIGRNLGRLADVAETFIQCQ